MADSNHNPAVRFCQISKATHFTGLQPVCGLIADKILQDDKPAAKIAITQPEIASAMKGR
jgi:hypothetical protein